MCGVLFISNCVWSNIYTCVSCRRDNNDHQGELLILKPSCLEFKTTSIGKRESLKFEVKNSSNGTIQISVDDSKLTGTPFDMKHKAVTVM